MTSEIRVTLQFLVVIFLVAVFICKKSYWFCKTSVILLYPINQVSVIILSLIIPAKYVYYLWNHYWDTIYYVRYKFLKNWLVRLLSRLLSQGNWNLNSYRKSKQNIKVQRLIVRRCKRLPSMSMEILLYQYSIGTLHYVNR